MLLPHGSEGQGPEHSSGRLERFLQACAEDNMIVANFSPPANYFHALRRQVKREARKPLIIMTPKSLLRHPEAVSTVEDLTEGSYQLFIPAEAEASSAKRLVLCSGQVYFYMLKAPAKLRLSGPVSLPPAQGGKRGNYSWGMPQAPARWGIPLLASPDS